MTKQEEILETLAKEEYEETGWGKLLEWRKEADILKDLCYQRAEKRLRLLSSMGCVLKVERELPTEPHRFGSINFQYDGGFTNGFKRCLNEMSQAGYIATMPLIEEKE